MRRIWWYGGSLLATVLFLVLAQATSKSSFPKSAFRELSRQISPVLQVRSVQKAFPAAGLTTISIESRDLEVEIVRAQDESIQIQVELEGRFAVENKDPLKVAMENSTLALKVSENLRRKEWLSRFSDTLRSNRLRLVLPKIFSGKLKIETTSGSTVLDRVRSLGEFQWESISGDLKVEDSEVFIAHLSSVSGQIFYQASTSELEVQTTSGDAHFQFSGLDRYLASKIDLASTSGRLDIEIPKESSIRFLVSSLTGVLQTEIPGETVRDRGEGQAREGQLGKGDGELRARTVSGDLIFKFKN